MSSQPTDELSDNIIGDITDALMTGIFSSILMKAMFGKNISMKSMLTVDTLMEGAKMGGAVALYRRLGRPVVNNLMNRSGLENVIKV